MNYLKTYIKLIRKALNREVPGTYVEKHHVFPVSIFGKNKRIVKLTAREHYIAHALLEKIYIKRYGVNHKNSKKMTHAFFLMNSAKSKGQLRYINSNLYEFNKLRMINVISGENSSMFGKKRVFTEEHLANMKKQIKYGQDNPLYGISRSEEIKNKIRKPKCAGHGESVSRSRKGMKFSEEHKMNLSLAHKGNIPGNKGKSKFTLKITNPLGKTTTTNNLADYCNKHGIPNEEFYLIRVAKGLRKQHKKFTAILISIKE